MKYVFINTLVLSIFMLGYNQLYCGLFQGIADTAETAVEGAVNVAEDAVEVVPAAVGIRPYDADNRRIDRRYERKMDRNYENDMGYQDIYEY